MINTVADLKKALESYPDYMEVRNVFDGAGNYYFPHVALVVADTPDKTGVILVLGQVKEPSLGSIKDIAEMRGNSGCCESKDKNNV